MVWLAVVLFALVKLAVPWELGTVDLAACDWRLLGEQLALTVAIGVVVWRAFENDGMVLIVVMVWLLAVPMWEAVTHFMEVANRPPSATAVRDRPGA